MSSWFNWFKIKNTDEIDNVKEIIEEKEDVFVEEKKEKKKVVFVEDKLVEEKEEEVVEEWYKGATFPSLEFTSYPTKTNTTEDIEQISIEMKDEDDIENISIDTFINKELILTLPFDKRIFTTIKKGIYNGQSAVFRSRGTFTNTQRLYWKNL